MFSQLTDSLESTLKNLRGQGKLTEENVAESLREVRRAFLEADVNFNVTRDFVKAVKEKALGSEVLNSVTPGQQIVKIIHDELVAVMGGETKEINLSGPAPVGIMMVGLQGSGKTTFAGKIALWMRIKKKRKPLLVAADCTAPPQSSSCRCSASPSAFPFTTKARAIRSKSSSTVTSTPRTTALTW